MRQVTVALLLLSILINFSQGFSVHPEQSIVGQTTFASRRFKATAQVQKQDFRQSPLSSSIRVRGGAESSNSALKALPLPEMTALLTSSLQSGSFGVVALTAIAAAVCIPITQYKNLYGISVGYGLSIAAVATVLRQTFLTTTTTASSLAQVLTGAALFYGTRLAVYLFVRDVVGMQRNSRPEPGRIKRLPFAISVAVFYALLTTPILYLLRSPDLATTTILNAFRSGRSAQVAWVGAGLAWMGVVLEAAADTQKFIVKMRHRGNCVDSNEFKGPNNFVYSLTRHPNYTGEVLFWSGVWVAGVPAFGSSVIAWMCSTAGLYGIVTIMRQATKGLESRQVDKYGGQELYEEWKQKVPAPLIPFVKGGADVGEEE
jgi:steroid 5-alpha reductase family enzyme